MNDEIMKIQVVGLSSVFAVAGSLWGAVTADSIIPAITMAAAVASAIIYLIRAPGDAAQKRQAQRYQEISDELYQTQRKLFLWRHVATSRGITEAEVMAHERRPPDSQ